METLQIVGISLIVILFIIFIARYVIKDKYIMTDVQNANVKFIIPAGQLPKQPSIPTNNFTYSMWLYVNDWNYNFGYYKPIFIRNGKPGVTIDAAYVNTVIQANNSKTILPDDISPSPMVVFGAQYNKIFLFMTNSDKSVFSCQVDNVPIQSWINMTFVLYTRTLDMYVNGKLSKTCIMPLVPLSITTPTDITLSSVAGDGTTKQNKEGFDGYISKFQYYPQAFNPQEVWKIYAKGYGTLSSTIGLYKLQITLIENGNAIKSLVI
jgi:hypothetical protein